MNIPCQKSRLLRQNTNMILKIKNQEVSIFNHYCVYKVFYFYLVILLPLITLIFKGPNSVYILSTYVITSFGNGNDIFAINNFNMKIYYLMCFLFISCCNSQPPKEYIRKKIVI